MPAVSPSRYLVQAGWDSVPHLDEKAKAEILASTPPHLRDARAHGIPSLGAGAVYPVPLSEIEVKPFPIPAFWRRGYALDVGWRRTAALWGAEDPSDGSIYLYAEHYRGQEVPAVHAEAIKARGNWITGAIDPAARGRQQSDGERLKVTYQALGLHLVNANNAVEAGLYEVWQRLETGRLKVFSTLQNFKAEYRMYRRDENGKIVKEFDHLMDCGRYLISTWAKIARVQKPTSSPVGASSGSSDAVAGY
jgi:hypothetical protein